MPENYFVNDHIRFLRESFTREHTIGAVVPSSAALTAKMLAPIDFTRARLIVELGPGTGVFTRALLSHMHPEAHLLALETNSNFRNHLRKIADPRLRVSGQSAIDLINMLTDSKADYIVSGIPLTLLTATEKHRLLIGVRDCLSLEGIFTQFQYSLESYGTLKSIFPKVDLTFTPWNVPPAFVYTCRR